MNRVGIPPERAALEGRLIWALDHDADAIADELIDMDWNSSPELVCLGLVEIAERQPRRERALVALKVSPWCERAAGPHCADCLVRVTRLRALRSSSASAA